MKNALTLFALFFTLPGFAQDIFQDKLYPTDFVLKYRDELGLSKQQINNIKKVYNANIGSYNSLKWDLDAELVNMGKLLSVPHIDSTATLWQMQKILELESALKLQRLSMLISVKNELSPAQQLELEKYKFESGQNMPVNLITAINENPRVVLKVDGPEVQGQPLFFIIERGKRRQTESVADIDPSRIKSISVIKGENATKEYGAEGRNGVVLIYLKK